LSEGQRNLEPAPEPDSAAPAPAEPVHPRPPTPLAEEAEGGASELTRRLLTAVVLVPTVIFVIVQGGLLYLGVVALFAVTGQREFYRMIEDKGAQPLGGLGLGFGLAVVLVSYVGSEYHALLLLTASLLGMMVAQLRKARIHEALASISGTFFGVFYVSWLLSHFVLLRNFHDVAVSKYGATDVLFLELADEAGVFLVMYTLAAVIWCDAGAYFVGRAYGRRKLAPEISPNKSVEGALGGVVLGTLAGLGMKLIFDTWWPELSSILPWSLAVIAGVVLSVVGIMGDLTESLLKRDADVKDAGQLLPGMGGILDRIDAPLLATPVMYYLMLGYLFIRVG